MVTNAKTALLASPFGGHAEQLTDSEYAECKEV